jgi:hypothetical protein
VSGGCGEEKLVTSQFRDTRKAEFEPFAGALWPCLSSLCRGMGIAWLNSFFQGLIMRGQGRGERKTPGRARVRGSGPVPVGRQAPGPGSAAAVYPPGKHTRNLEPPPGSQVTNPCPPGCGSPPTISMACSSVDGVCTLSEVRVVGLYQYTSLPSFPLEDNTDVPFVAKPKRRTRPRAPSPLACSGRCADARDFGL